VRPQRPGFVAPQPWSRMSLLPRQPLSDSRCAQRVVSGQQISADALAGVHRLDPFSSACGLEMTARSCQIGVRQRPLGAPERRHVVGHRFAKQGIESGPVARKQGVLQKRLRTAARSQQAGDDCHPMIAAGAQDRRQRRQLRRFATGPRRRLQQLRIEVALAGVERVQLVPGCASDGCVIRQKIRPQQTLHEPALTGTRQRLSLSAHRSGTQRRVSASYRHLPAFEGAGRVGFSSCRAGRRTCRRVVHAWAASDDGEHVGRHLGAGCRGQAIQGAARSHHQLGGSCGHTL